MSQDCSVEAILDRLDDLAFAVQVLQKMCRWLIVSVS